MTLMPLQWPRRDNRLACEEGGGMGYDSMTFGIVVGSNGDGSIQAAKGQRQLIAVQGRGARHAGPIK
jgi:hypothetical protein